MFVALSLREIQAKMQAGGCSSSYPTTIACTDGPAANTWRLLLDGDLRAMLAVFSGAARLAKCDADSSRLRPWQGDH
jgi:hypothetical protein